MAEEGSVHSILRLLSIPVHSTQYLSGLSVPCIEDEMHVTRVAQAFKFLAETRDPTVRRRTSPVGRGRLESMCVPRSVPLSIDQLPTFLNTPAPSQDDARGDLKSLWSSVRPILQHTHATILLSQESASVNCDGFEVCWAKRHDINRVLKLATQTRHLNMLQEEGRASFSTCLANRQITLLTQART